MIAKWRGLVFDKSSFVQKGECEPCFVHFLFQIVQIKAIIITLEGDTDSFCHAGCRPVSAESNEHTVASGFCHAGCWTVTVVTQYLCVCLC